MEVDETEAQRVWELFQIFYLKLEELAAPTNIQTAVHKNILHSCTMINIRYLCCHGS